jgi:hypothetical protein
MEQIGNVFYNLLGMLAQSTGDVKLIGVSQKLRDEIQAKKFSNLFDNNVPYAGFDKINLLRTIDMPMETQAQLMNSTNGQLLQNSMTLISSAVHKEHLDLKLEATSMYHASKFSIVFCGFKTP